MEITAKNKLDGKLAKLEGIRDSRRELTQAEMAVITRWMYNATGYFEAINNLGIIEAKDELNYFARIDHLRIWVANLGY